VLCNVFILGKLKAHNLASGVDDVASAPNSFVSALYASIAAYIVSMMLTILDVWVFQSHEKLRLQQHESPVVQPYRLLLPFTAFILMSCLRLVQDFTMENSDLPLALVLACHALLYVSVFWTYYRARLEHFEADDDDCCILEEENDGDHAGSWILLLMLSMFVLASSCVCIALGWHLMSAPLSFLCLVTFLLFSCALMPSVFCSWFKTCVDWEH